MANRFARRIRDGDIGTPEELKAEFKSLAKETHPDIAGPGGAAEFMRVREEYETALRDFRRHRFGVREAGLAAARPRADGSRGFSGARGSAGSGDSGAESVADSVADAFAALSVLLKRGFPKEPRHEKERLRYDYARWGFSRALVPLSEAAAAGFPAFEARLLGLRKTSPKAVSAALSYLGALADYAAAPLPELRTALLVDLGALRSSPFLPPDALRFLADLSAVFGIGSALPA